GRFGQRDALSGGGPDCEAARERKRQNKKHRPRPADAVRPLLHPALAPVLKHQFSPTTSICSGRDASILGPFRSSIQPRMRTVRLSSCFGDNPAPEKMRSCRFDMVTVSASDHRRPKFKYIVPPLSRTDKTLPSTSENRPRAANKCGALRASITS